jgi:hypothetical protein
MEERVAFIRLLTSEGVAEGRALDAIQSCAESLRTTFASSECDDGRAIAALDALTQVATCCSQAFAFPAIKEAR